MIRIVKKLRKEKGLYLIVTELDAKAACITTDYEKEVIDYYLEEHLTKVSKNVENEFILERFKEFLIDTIFVHYVDLIGVLNYIYNIKETIRTAKAHPSHSKFLFVTEFKNYVGDKSEDEKDEPDSDEEDSKFVNVSFRTELLDRKDLGFTKRMLFTMFNCMYESDILVMKPKKVEISLEEKETPKGTKEFVTMDTSFCKPDK